MDEYRYVLRSKQASLSHVTCDNVCYMPCEEFIVYTLHDLGRCALTCNAKKLSCEQHFSDFILSFSFSFFSFFFEGGVGGGGGGN